MNFNRGINLGGFLSQCAHTAEHYESFVTESDIARIAADGFDHVRLPVDYEVLESQDGAFLDAGFRLVEKIIRLCGSKGLNIVLDLHKAYGYDFNDAGDAAKNSLFSDGAAARRFLRLWNEISGRFGNLPNVAFELLNEVVEKENAQSWNSLIVRAVAAVRKNAPSAPIIYGGIQWNSVRTLRLLEKPADKNIIWTFHFYEPLLFTHQKAYWVPALKDCESVHYPDAMETYRERSRPVGYQGDAVIKCRAAEMGIPFIMEMIQDGVAAAQKAGVPLYCGEFGVIDRAPLPDAVRWFRDVDQVFRRYKIGCAVWNFRQKDFGLYDGHFDSVRRELLDIWMRK